MGPSCPDGLTPVLLGVPLLGVRPSPAASRQPGRKGAEGCRLFSPLSWASAQGELACFPLPSCRGRHTNVSPEGAVMLHDSPAPQPDRVSQVSARCPTSWRTRHEAACVSPDGPFQPPACSRGDPWENLGVPLLLDLRILICEICRSPQTCSKTLASFVYLMCIYLAPVMGGCCLTEWGRRLGKQGGVLRGASDHRDRELARPSRAQVRVEKQKQQEGNQRGDGQRHLG